MKKFSQYFTEMDSMNMQPAQVPAPPPPQDPAAALYQSSGLQNAINGVKSQLKDNPALLAGILGMIQSDLGNKPHHTYQQPQVGNNI